MRKFLNEIFSGYLQFIEINSNHSRPATPFATFQILSTDPAGVDNIVREKSSTNDNMVTEIIQKMYQDTAQIDIYANSLSECNSIARRIIAKLQYRYREILTDRGFGLVNITSIVPITSKGVSEVESRVSFNIIYSYCENYADDIENVESVIYRGKEWSEWLS